MDEARFGQKGRVCHRWFTRGERPPGLCDQRFSWTHLFAAVRPATGEGFALVLPQQQGTNNVSKCFEWWLPGDQSRDQMAGTVIPTGKAPEITRFGG